VKPNEKSSTRSGGGKEKVIVNKSSYSRYCMDRKMCIESCKDCM